VQGWGVYIDLKKLGQFLAAENAMMHGENIWAGPWPLKLGRPNKSSGMA
jgi:hypothetical protein